MKKPFLALITLLIASANLSSQVIDSLWEKGIKAFSVQNFHGTIAYLDSLLVLNPVIGEAYYNRGLAKINLGDMNDACIDFQLAQQYSTSITKDFIDYQCNP